MRNNINRHGGRRSCHRHSWSCCGFRDWLRDLAEVIKAFQYGESVANALSKLEMEFFKFQAWWVVLERIAADPRKQTPRSGRVAKATSKAPYHLPTSASPNSFMGAASIPSLTPQQLFSDCWSSARIFWNELDHSRHGMRRLTCRRTSQQRLVLEQISSRQKAATRPS